MSNVIVFGAHGKVGQRLIGLLAKSKTSTTAIVRSSAQAEQIKKVAEGLEVVKTAELDLATASVKELTSSVQGHSAIVLTVGSAGKDLLKVDLDGVVKVFEAAVQAKVRRLVLVSALFAETPELFEKTSLRDYYIAKHYADRILINEFGSKLDYTILKPSHLGDGDGVGKIGFIKHGDDPKAVDRQDVAHVITLILDRKSTFGKSYNFTTGDEPIESDLTWN